MRLTEVMVAYDQQNAGAPNARITALQYLKDKGEDLVETGWWIMRITTAQEKLDAK